MICLVGELAKSSFPESIDKDDILVDEFWNDFFSVSDSSLGRHSIRHRIRPN